MNDVVPFRPRLLGSTEIKALNDPSQKLLIFQHEGYLIVEALEPPHSTVLSRNSLSSALHNYPNPPSQTVLLFLEVPTSKL